MDCLALAIWLVPLNGWGWWTVRDVPHGLGGGALDGSDGSPVVGLHGLSFVGPLGLSGCERLSKGVFRGIVVSIFPSPSL